MSIHENVFKRAMECIKACEGMTAPGPMIGEMEWTIDTLMEYLAEAHSVETNGGDCEGKSCSYCQAIENARDLLARLKGDK